MAKVKQAGFNKYSEVPGTVCHIIISKGLGWPDDVVWEYYWNCCLSAVDNEKFSVLAENAM